VFLNNVFATSPPLPLIIENILYTILICTRKQIESVFCWKISSPCCWEMWEFLCTVPEKCGTIYAGEHILQTPIT